MIKRGSSHLRWALIQAAIKVARYSPKFKAYLRIKLEQGKRFNVAISHVAKKLIRVLFHLLKNSESFDEVKLIKIGRILKYFNYPNFKLHNSVLIFHNYDMKRQQFSV